MDTFPVTKAAGARANGVMRGLTIYSFVFLAAGAGLGLLPIPPLFYQGAFGFSLFLAGLRFLFLVVRGLIDHYIALDMSTALEMRAFDMAMENPDEEEGDDDLLTLAAGMPDDVAALLTGEPEAGVTLDDLAGALGEDPEH